MSHRVLCRAAALTFLIAAAPALAQAPQAVPAYPMGDGDFDPAEAAAVRLAPLTRAYIPEAIDLSPKFPPPGRQNEIGSCISWSTGYAARSYYEIAQSGSAASDESRTISPAYLHQLLVATAGGTCKAPQANIYKALAILKVHGAITLSQYPAKPEENFCKAVVASEAAAGHYKINDFETVGDPAKTRVGGKRQSGLGPNSLDRMRLALSSGNPVLVSMVIGKSFMRLSGNQTYAGSIHTKPGDYLDEDAAHAMVITGYDDRKRAFRLMNSWGTEWNDGGFAWVDYDTMMSDARYAVVMKVGDAAPPRPVPSQPASPVPPMANDLNLQCAELREERQVSGKPLLTGFVSRQKELDALNKVASLKDFDSKAVLRPWPVCEALLTLHEPLNRPGRPKIELADGDRTLKVGERFSVKVTSPDVPAFLYLVYIEDDGTVVNLAPRLGPIRRQLAAKTVLLYGDGKEGRPSFKVSAPKGVDENGKARAANDPERGHEAIIAIAARAPIEELEALEKPDSPVYARMTAKPQQTGVDAQIAPPDRLYLSALRDIVLQRAAPDTLPREVAADVLHIKISE